MSGFENSPFEEKYGLLPEVTETVVESLMSEVSEFVDLMQNSPDRAKRNVLAEVNWLKERKDFLGALVEASVDPALDLVSDKLVHADWDALRIYLLKGILLVLHGLNLALERGREDGRSTTRV